MGCLESLYLLHNQTQEWKDKYIKMWIPVSPALGGTLKTA
jgi:hypothetical protein